MNKSLEPPVIAMASERQLQAALDDAEWYAQLKRWVEQGWPIIFGNPRRIDKATAERMQVRLNTLVRIAEEAMEQP